MCPPRTHLSSNLISPSSTYLSSKNLTFVPVLFVLQELNYPPSLLCSPRTYLSSKDVPVLLGLICLLRTYACVLPGRICPPIQSLLQGRISPPRIYLDSMDSIFCAGLFQSFLYRNIFVLFCCPGGLDFFGPKMATRDSFQTFCHFSDSFQCLWCSFQPKIYV